MGYDWKTDYVKNNKLVDGWYYIKQDVNVAFESALPPTRCINVYGGLFFPYIDRYYTVTPEMVASPAYTIGKEYEFNEAFGNVWYRAEYTGYDFTGVHGNSEGDSDYCRPIESERKIEITVSINGKECKLSDISEDTLLKIREKD